MKDARLLDRGLLLLFWGLLLRSVTVSLFAPTILVSGRELDTNLIVHAGASLAVLYGISRLLLEARQLWVKAALLLGMVAFAADVANLVLDFVVRSGERSGQFDIPSRYTWLVTVPAFCLGMWAFSGNLRFTRASRSWRTSLALVLACLALLGAFAGYAWSQGWLSGTSPVHVTFAERIEFTIHRVSATGPPVEVEREANPLITLGLAGWYLVTLAAWTHILLSIGRTRRAVQHQVGLTQIAS